MVKAVTAHADVPWVVLYVKRWLCAPLALPDGTLRQRDRGTPQGSAMTPPTQLEESCFEVSLSYRRVELPRRVSAVV